MVLFCIYLLLPWLLLGWIIALKDAWLVGLCVCLLSHFSRVQLSATPWAIACQAPLSMGLSRKEYWSGLPFPFPGDLPDPGTEPASLSFPA